VSSISVMAVPPRGEKLSESTPFEANSRTGGPNAWGKIESERLAVARCREFGIELRVVRPSALVDYRQFDPPGLLGRRLGNMFVAVGMPSHKLGVVDVVFSGQTLAWMVRHFDEVPVVLNLFEPELPTKRELLARLRGMNPDLTVFWLYPFVLMPLSWFAFALQKVLRPSRPALSIAKMFARLQYDTSLIRKLAPAIRAESEHRALSHDAGVAPPNHGAFAAPTPALQSA
jgi:nucleoside-diphosphate-sugar epimerase